MKSVRLLSFIAVGLVFAAGCSSSSTDTGGSGGSPGTGGSTLTGGSPGTGTGGSTVTGGSAGNGTGGSAGAAGSTITPGQQDDACDEVPCASPWVCCPSTNTCTPADTKICASPVWVACTKASDCPGQTCWVTPATTTGSGPSGSVCAATMPAGAQGVACNAGPAGGKTKDCPAPASKWDTCFPVSHSPGGLGVCVEALVADH